MTAEKKISFTKMLKDSATVGTMTLISRVLGMIRDIAIANFLGASIFADAFFIAFKIPNFFRRLCAEGAFSQAFIPVLSEYKKKHSFYNVKLMLGNVGGTFSIFLLLLTSLGIIFSPQIIRLFAPGFPVGTEKLAVATDLLRITFPYLCFISITAFFGAILNSYGNFTTPSLSPCILNICLIIATVFVSDYFAIPVFSLAWGVFLAGILQLIFQLYFVWKMNILAKPSFNYKSPVIKKIVTLTIPALFSVSISQINLILDTVLASFLENGSISWLYYADRLSELPLGVIGIAIATVILPSLSKQYNEKSKEHFSDTMSWAISLALLIGLPCSCALYIIAEPLLSTIFGYGKMESTDISMSALALKAYSLGLMAFMLIKILASGYFSQQNTKTPVSIAIKAMIANMILNLLLIVPLKHTGLALATSISAWLNTTMLFYGLVKLKTIKIDKKNLIYLFKLVFATLVMGIILEIIHYPIEVIQKLSIIQRVLHLTLLVLVGCISYFACLFIVKFPLNYIWCGMYRKNSCS